MNKKYKVKAEEDKVKGTPEYSLWNLFKRIVNYEKTEPLDQDPMSNTNTNDSEESQEIPTTNINENHSNDTEKKSENATIFGTDLKNDKILNGDGDNDKTHSVKEEPLPVKDIKNEEDDKTKKDSILREFIRSFILKILIAMRIDKAILENKGDWDRGFRRILKNYIIEEEIRKQTAKLEKAIILDDDLKNEIQKKVFSKGDEENGNDDNNKPESLIEVSPFRGFILDESPGVEQPLPQKKHAFKNGFIDFLAGSIGGVAQVYIAQPLDTIKVKQQTFPKLYTGMINCLSQTYRASGIKGLYAGTVPAAVASVTENSVLFMAYGQCQRVVAAIRGVKKIEDLSVTENAFAGSLASAFSTMTLCPTELVKCKLQAIQEIKPYVAQNSKVMAITPRQLATQIYKTEGIAGFYHGLSSTFVREIPGFFFFFGSYEATRQYFADAGRCKKDDIGALKTMTAGSVGGITLWTSTFPADVIKSRIQIKSLKESMLTVGIDIVRKEGVSALYNGLFPSIVRTIPATATLFLVYENTKKIMTATL